MGRPEPEGPAQDKDPFSSSANSVTWPASPRSTPRPGARSAPATSALRRRGTRPGSAAAVLLVEDLWAAPLASALDRSGGLLIEGARIPQDLLDAEITELATAS